MESLKLHKAPVLAILLISLGRRCPTDANVGNWVEKAVDRGVVVVKFKLRWSAGPTILPKSLYTCKTLKELSLSDKVLVDFPSYSPSCLPSLEILQLFCVAYKDEASLARFLSSCPVLGILIVKRKKSDNLTNFIVKVSSLWMLSYHNTAWLQDDTDVMDSGSCLVIDTPALIKFEVDDDSRDSWSIGNMPCLEKAYISVNSLSNFDKFITAASSAILSLDLTFTDEMLVRCSTLRFSRLIKLSVDPSRSDWVEPLLLLLANTPKLEQLLVNYWVEKAVERGVLVVKFKLRWTAGPTRLPKSLYACKTLRELTLSYKILVDIPSSSCLPSLKKLRLFCVVYKDESSLARFLSSCPVLIYLAVKRKTNDNLTKFVVKVPSLRVLWYHNPTWQDDSDLLDTGSCLVIDTPSSTTISVTDHSRDSWSIRNMPCLEEADISVNSLSSFDKIITASSTILSLDLTFTDEMLVRCSTLRFSRLIRLSVDPSISDWVEPLLLLLVNTPKLEELLVNNL
ncbi:unnamed protein product [Eruca vesicaria subsp. sativa]|uniref:F-box/LRR-repeat protein 15/At3g58940/PEG3-like LRR domain-containing protein n=1 Tax=Eruca vesicaria subsp. sativa TaxID=29727 RepID=A0ABC8KFP9_ERUVS|nr:unnamed protein product [Eruca vesicaria subsp. sativa]